MIGVIGSTDSVRLTLEVAAEIGISGSVVARAYESFEEAPALATELDRVCNALLFTGHVPYVLAEADTRLHAVLDFVPYSGTDFYRALGLVLRDHAGRLPSLSVDTIGAATVQETCRDLGLEPPRHVVSMESEASPSGFRSAEEVSTFHQRLFEAGAVELCLTCLGSVRSRLERARVPVVRIEHTRLSLRDALTRATLADRLARTETAQLTVVMLKPDSRSELPGSAVLRPGATALAQMLHGSLSTTEDAYYVHTTRGAADALLERLGASRAAITGRFGLPPDVRIGVGVGGSGAAAEENARQAAKLSEDEDHVAAVLADGSVRLGTGGDADPKLTLRETRDQMLLRARATGMGTMTLARLAAALRVVNPHAFTARELAEVYGVEPRSARRLLTRLEQAGIVTVAGVQAPARAGRPQTVYRADVDKLLKVS